MIGNYNKAQMQEITSIAKKKNYKDTGKKKSHLATPSLGKA